MSVRMTETAPPARIEEAAASERNACQQEIATLEAKVSFLEQMLATKTARGNDLPLTAPVVLYFDNQVERGEWLRSAVHRLPRHHIPRQTK